MSLRLGLIGHPVSHSLSPPMHRAALSFFGLLGSYELVDLDPSQYTDELELGNQIRTQLAGFSGFNVTIPHKQLLYALVDERSPEADLLSAVNTVRIDSAGRMLGFNTDLSGFMSALKQNCPDMEGLRNVLVLGAGGAARAVIAGLFLSGARRVVVVVRNPTAAVQDECQQLSMKVSALTNTECRIVLSTFSDLYSPDPQSVSSDSVSTTRSVSSDTFSLVVNCTPIGLNSDNEEPSWCQDIFRTGTSTDSFFFDTVYRKDRSPTLLMKTASKLGFKTCDGLSMLVEQARFAFEIWTERRINAEYMLDALK